MHRQTLLLLNTSISEGLVLLSYFTIWSKVLRFKSHRHTQESFLKTNINQFCFPVPEQSPIIKDSKLGSESLQKNCL